MNSQYDSHASVTTNFLLSSEWFLFPPVFPKGQIHHQIRYLYLFRCHFHSGVSKSKKKQFCLRLSCLIGNIVLKATWEISLFDQKAKKALCFVKESVSDKIYT